MSELSVMNGSCLCGAVNISTANHHHEVGACHCNMCRKWGGSSLLVVDCQDDVEFAGTEIGIYESSDWAERGFCKQCGTHLFYRLKKKQQYYIPVGIFDRHEKNFVFDHQIFIDEKPDYYAFANETKKLTGEEVLATFAASFPEE